MAARSPLLLPGYFLDVQISGNWTFAYITAVSGSSQSVVFCDPQRHDAVFSEVSASDALPVFSHAKKLSEAAYDGRVLTSQLEQLGYADTAFADIDRIVARTQESTEARFQLYSCHLPLIVLKVEKTPEEVISRVELLAQLCTAYLKELLHDGNHRETSLLGSIWSEFRTYIPRLFHGLSRTDHKHAVVSALSSAGYFQAAFDLLASEYAEKPWIQHLAEVSLVSLSNPKDLRFQLLSGYKPYITPRGLERIWSSTGPFQKVEVHLPFLPVLESLHREDQPPFTSLFQDLFNTLLASGNQAMQRCAILMLKDAIIGKKPHSSAIIRVPENVQKLAAVSQSAAAEVAEIFNHLEREGSLASLLQTGGTGLSGFIQPAIVFPIVEKKDWKALSLLCDSGFRLSLFKDNKDLCDLLVLTAVGRTIPVALFERMVDIEVTPIMDVYYLILRRYSRVDQMMALRALAKSHLDQLKNLMKLPRAREEVEEMLRMCEVYNPRLHMIWAMERLNLKSRLPRGLIMCVVLEFAYPLRW